MKFTEKEILDFRLIYKKHFREEIDDDLARKKLALLVRQMTAVYKPVTAQEFNEYVNENGNGRRIRKREQ